MYNHVTVLCASHIHSYILKKIGIVQLSTDQLESMKVKEQNPGNKTGELEGEGIIKLLLIWQRVEGHKFYMWC